MTHLDLRSDPPLDPLTPDPPVQRVKTPQLVIPIITNRDIPQRMLVPTPGHMPDYILTAVSPLAVIIASAGKTFFTSFVGFWTATPLVAQITGQTMGIMTIRQTLQQAALLALIPTITAVATTLGLLFTQLSQKFPVLGKT